MMYEWFLIDSRTKSIVNCLTTSKNRRDAWLHLKEIHFQDDMEYIILKSESELSPEMLQAYEYWDKRP